jgi:hypothetical protein
LGCHINRAAGTKKAPPEKERLQTEEFAEVLDHEEVSSDQDYAASSYTVCISQRGLSMSAAMISANIMRIGGPNMVSIAMAGISISFMIVLSINGFNRKTEERPAVLHVFL